MLDVSHVVPVDGPVWVHMVLGVEFLKMHASHELLRCRETSSAHVLLWVLVHVMMLGLRMSLLLRLLLMLLLRIRRPIHHVGLLHLVGVSTAHLAIDVTVHDAVHHIPLPHDRLHGALRAPAVVHELPVGKCPQAGLGSVWGRAVHSHAIPVQASAGGAVGHGHHHVFGHLQRYEKNVNNEEQHSMSAKT